MKTKKFIIIGVAIALLTASCNPGSNKSDAYGNFEASDYIISAENSGKIISLNVEEGDMFSMATEVGLIDTVQLYLKREQLKAREKSVASGIQNILSRIGVYQEQKSVLEKDKQRIVQMFKDGAATQKQLDDINGNIQVIEKQVLAVRTENAKVLGELESIKHQVSSLNDLIQKSRIFVPEPATVLEKYHDVFEVVNAGTPLFKLADMRTMDLRVYVSGAQLSQINIGDKVDVMIDKNSKENQILEGTVTWIASQSEFTPKIIQTKEERVKLVYAVKVAVKNDGRLKIGMPGEIRIR